MNGETSSSEGASIARAIEPADTHAQPASAASVGNRPEFKLFPDDAQFDFEARRALGEVDYGGSAVGEVLVAVSHIRPGGYDSWYEAWNALAEKWRARRIARARAATM